MPELLDWRRVPQPEAVSRFTASVLRQGALVAFPSESTYLVAASAVTPGAVERLRSLTPDRPLDVAVPCAAQARDWLPEMGQAARRLVRRFWPGPLSLICGEGAPAGLLARLPETTRAALDDGGALRLRQPDHVLFQKTLERTAVPVVVAPIEAATLRQTLDLVGAGIDLAIDDAPCPLGTPATAVFAEGSAWHIRSAGALSPGQLHQQMACVIVFVCTGNTCRSPLAEAICKMRLAARMGCTVDELPERGWLVLSAGLAAGPGMPAADEAIAVAATLGADLSNHQSRPLWPELAARADHLVAMTRSHVRTILDHFPAGVRPRLLAISGEDIADPIGQPRSVYEACAHQLAGCIDQLLEEIAPPPGPRP